MDKVMETVNVLQDANLIGPAVDRGYMDSWINGIKNIGLRDALSGALYKFGSIGYNLAAGVMHYLNPAEAAVAGDNLIEEAAQELQVPVEEVPVVVQSILTEQSVAAIAETQPVLKNLPKKDSMDTSAVGTLVTAAGLATTYKWNVPAQRPSERPQETGPSSGPPPGPPPPPGPQFGPEEEPPEMRRRRRRQERRNARMRERQQETERNFKRTKLESDAARRLDEFGQLILKPDDKLPPSLPQFSKPWGARTDLDSPFGTREYVASARPELETQGWEQWRAAAAAQTASFVTLEGAAATAGVGAEYVYPGAGPWVQWMGSQTANVFFKNANQESFNKMLGVDQGYWGAPPSAEEMARIMGVSPEDMVVAELWGSLGGLEYLWNEYVVEQGRNRFRGPHIEINDIRAQMTPEMLALAEQIQGSNIGIFGEITVPGAAAPLRDRQLGSFRTYLYKMILLDFEAVKRRFAAMILRPDENAHLGMELIKEFMTMKGPKIASRLMRQYIAIEGVKGYLYLWNKMKGYHSQILTPETPRPYPPPKPKGPPKPKLYELPKGEERIRFDTPKGPKPKPRPPGPKPRPRPRPKPRPRPRVTPKGPEPRPRPTPKPPKPTPKGPEPRPRPTPKPPKPTPKGPEPRPTPKPPKPTPKVRPKPPKPTPKVRPKPKPTPKVRPKPKPGPRSVPRVRPRTPEPKPQPKVRPIPNVKAKPKGKRRGPGSKVQYKKKKKKKKRRGGSPGGLPERPKEGPKRVLIRETLLSVFRRLDKDKSGRLTAKELAPLAKRFKMTGRELMKQMDQKADSYIEFTEFERYMRKRASEVL